MGCSPRCRRETARSAMVGPAYARQKGCALAPKLATPRPSPPQCSFCAAVVRPPPLLHVLLVAAGSPRRLHLQGHLPNLGVQLLCSVRRRRRRYELHGRPAAYGRGGAAASAARSGKTEVGGTQGEAHYHITDSGSNNAPRHPLTSHQVRRRSRVVKIRRRSRVVTVKIKSSNKRRRRLAVADRSREGGCCNGRR